MRSRVIGMSRAELKHGVTHCATITFPFQSQRRHTATSSINALERAPRTELEFSVQMVLRCQRSEKSDLDIYVATIHFVCHFFRIFNSRLSIRVR